jgi:hypothetical protein
MVPAIRQRPAATFGGKSGGLFDWQARERIRTGYSEWPRASANRPALVVQRHSGPFFSPPVRRAVLGRSSRFEPQPAGY